MNPTKPIFLFLTTNSSKKELIGEKLKITKLYLLLNVC